MKLLITSTTKKIIFETNDNNLYKILLSDLPGRILPLTKIYEIEMEKYNNIDAEVIYLLSKEFKKFFKFPHIHIEVQKYSKLEPMFVILQVLERLYEEEGKYIIESSAVSKDKKGILIYGTSGSGKTVVALSLFNIGYEPVSNERTLINDRKIYGGTNVFNIKEYTLSYVPINFKEHLKKFVYSNDYYTYLLNLNTNKDVDLSLIVEVMTFPDLATITISELPKGYINMKLFESATSLIRGVLTPLNNFENVSDNLDTDTLAENRIKNLFSIDVPSYRIIGNPKNVAKAIDNLYRELYE
jgi:hypothetical protein